MKILVKFFANYREAVGKSEEEFEAPEGATVRDVVDALAAKYPPLRSMTGAIFILNQQIVDSSVKLEDGYTLAISPLVGGG